MRVVAGVSWPSQSAMTVMSTPAWSRFIAAVCRRVCGVTCLTCSDGQVRAAVAACFATRPVTASWDSRVPRRGREQGAGVGGPACGKPAGQDADGVRGQRGAAVLAAFAAAVDMRADTELEVAGGQSGQFRDA